MSRELKFRGWDNNKKYFHTIELKDGSANIGLYRYWENQGENLENITWQQFTGIKDKNGKEIYEGDIVLLENEKDEFLKKKVVFGWGYFGLFRGFKLKPSMLWAEIVEIIGNIFENPELIN